MTRLLEEAVATVASLPDEQQDEFARILLRLAGQEQPVYVLTPEEEADLRGGGARRFQDRRGNARHPGEVCTLKIRYTGPAHAEMAVAAEGC